ncbi:hypothetical protein D6745_01745, partial [Candidatus Woesearchaeota archaeon]
IIEVARNNKISTFHSTEDLKNDIKRGKNYLDLAYSKKFVREAEKRCKEHKTFFQKLKKTKYYELTEKQLFNLLLKITDEWCKTIAYFRATQAEGTHYLQKKIKGLFSDKEASVLMTPVETDDALRELIDWQRLVKQPFSKKNLLNHADKYPWVVAVHFTKDDVIETLTQRYKFDKDHMKLRDIKKEKDKLKKKQEKILRRHPKIRPYVDLLQKLAVLRMEVKSCWAGTDYYIIPLINEISRRTKENVYDIGLYYLIEDIKNLLAGKPLSKEAKEQRKKCFLGLWKNKKLIFESGDKAEEIAKKELGELYKIPRTNKLKGHVANPGRTTGVARILESNNVQQLRELRKTFKKGEILITQMTQPNVMDIASKASAIVTDEGGMLSHAAIISREFKIPCIVGTHFATETIKDGDLVEVDANKGIVRKISNDGKKIVKQEKIRKVKKMVRAKSKTSKTRYRPDLIVWFREIDKSDIPLVGGKGANLGEMFSKFPVPNGFCVTVNAYKQFLDETGIGAHIHGLLDKVDVENTSQLENTSKKIRELILKQEFPEGIKKEIIANYKKLKIKKVAVRSSATAEDLPGASFAGQQDTYLNVKGEKEVVRAVQKCWASLFTSRAIYYREKNNFRHRDVLISVVVQEMVNAKYAGVMFTVDPVNKKYILIEVVEGLGEALVSGQVTPNSYFMDKKTHKVREKTEHFSIDNKLIEEVSRIGEKIEKHYKCPQDIEFAFDSKHNLWITQARPITTL